MPAPARPTVALAVAAAYFCFAMIGMSLALPPAGATPLFPAAGLAVAAALRYGLTALVGIWLGQAGMQLARFVLAGGVPTVGMLACWALISLGAALQAALAVALVRHREARQPHERTGGSHSFALLFLSGMIACTVSATFGVGTLWAAGIVREEEVLRSWWDWYSGDTIGVFILAPLILLLLERPDAGWDHGLPQILLRTTLIAGIILVVFVATRQREGASVEAALREESLTIANGIASHALTAGRARAAALPIIFRMADASRDYLGTRPLPKGLRCRLLREQGDGDDVVFDSGEGPLPRGRRQRAPIPIADGPWSVECTAGNRYQTRGYDLSWAVALLSLFFTGILADRDLAALAARSRETAALVEKERIRRDLAIARDIQQGLLPKEAARLAGFDIAGWSEPADETGGDYFDFVPLGQDLLAVAIADVTGHGIGAALVVAEVRAVFRAEIMRSRDLHSAVTDMYPLVAGDLPAGRLVTACFGLVSAESGRISYLSAGHGPILVRSAATGTVRTLPPHGPPLGFLPEARYTAPVEVPLDPGDVFIVLTDGFYEWTSRGGEPFGVERIVKFLGAHGDLTARELIDRLREAVVSFAAGTPQADDLTAVVVRREPRAGVPA